MNAAVAFVLLGASLWLLSDVGHTRFAIAGQACAAAAVLIGMATLAQYATGWNLGIDEFLTPDPAEDSPHPGRIPLAGAVNFTLLGVALLLLNTRAAEARWAPQWLVLTAALISFVVILGYSYDVSSLYRVRSSSPVALHGVLTFIALSVGVLFARPDRGLIKRVIAADAGGFLIRRLLPAAVLAPTVIGWLRLQGEQAGLYGSDVGLAIYATANVVVFTGLIWSTASTVRRADAERSAAELKLRAQMARLDLLNHITRAIGERQDLRSVFQVVIRSLQDRLSIDLCCIALYEPATNVLNIEVVGARSETLAVEFRMAEHGRLVVESNGLARCVQGALVYEPDTRQVGAAFPQRLAQSGLHSLVIAPLLVESKVFGVLIAARHESASFTSADCEFLKQLSQHVALATHQMQLYDALQRAYEDLRQSQQTMMQQERLRALGQMASLSHFHFGDAVGKECRTVVSLLRLQSS